MSPLAIVAWVVGVLLVLALLAVAIWWLRTQSGAAIRSFYGAVRHMEQEQGVQDRYQSPWLLMLGNDAQGAQLCSSWHLLPTDKPAWFGRWWSDPDGAVLVVPESLFLPDEGLKLKRGSWWRLLGLILRLRARRPLDGVIWTVSASRLWDDEQAAALGIAARRRFIDLLQRLGLSLPVYVVVTEMEQIPGFQELITALPKESRERTLGWTSPFAPETLWQSEWSDQALDQVTRVLVEAITEVGALSGQLSEDLYGLPERFEALRRNLQTLLDPVFQGNAQNEAPRFRGMYFTASEAPGSAPVFSASDIPLLQSTFSRQLWQRRIVAEQGLAQVVPRLLRLRQRWQRVVGVTAAIVGLIWVVGMVWVWQDSLKDARELAHLLEGAQKGYVTVVDDNHRLGPTRRNVQAFWQLMEQSPRWHFASLVLPTSWFSYLDHERDQMLREVAMKHMVLPLRDLLQMNLTQLRAIQNTDRRPNLESEDPSQWQTYVKSRDLVERATALEQQYLLFTKAVNNHKTPLDDLASLSNLALGLNLNAATLHRAAFYNQHLAKIDLSNLIRVDLPTERLTIGGNFKELMGRWLDQYYLAENFVRQAGYLKLHLDQLESGAVNSLAELEDLKAMIDDLQAVVSLTNSTWSRGKGQDLVPGYSTLMDKVRQSALLGAPLEQSLEDQASRLQQSFRDQWIAKAGSRGNLLIQQGSGQLVLQEHVLQLNNAIAALFRRDFVAMAMRADDSAGGSYQSLDSDGLNNALTYFASYKSYASEEMPRIPPAYRGPMLRAAENAAAKAMWLSLESSRGQTPGTAAFNIKTDQALAVQSAFIELKRADLASNLQNSLNRRALAEVGSGLEQINAQSVFHERVDIDSWDGSKNLGLQLFRANDVPDLKLDLKQQFTSMQTIAEAREPALEWLKAQQQNLGAGDFDRFTRLNSLHDELLKYKEQNPASSPALIEQLVSRDFIDMDAGSCGQILSSANLPAGQGELALRAVALQQGAMRRCQALQQAQAVSAWNELAGYFNQYLSERFPFSHGVQAADAEPARVQHLLELIDTRLPKAQAGLVLSQSPERLAAADFLERLKQARVWLGPLFQRDPSGMIGFDMDVRWRTDREEERGADQVIAWGLNAGSQQISYPGDTQQRLRWMVGQPLRLTLRWARNGPERPVSDPLQPSLAVADLEAGWEYGGPWSLLRMMRSHLSVIRQPSMDYTDFPLTLRLPVRGSVNGDSQTTMFIRLSLMTQGGKLPLSLAPLPVRAPSSPFSSFGTVSTATGNQGAL
ncbi:type VI secretion system protein [Pseudomonas gingeri]|uniref:Type VI secretion system protein ImpL n=2 Tax=Gammaproteobacteria TaxID=1236 RepID=A0A7Y8CMF4_9PSED|nr:type VI secretion protein IcmF/TssM N-terminal domain-containing protein [Pseudomonas gingeri]NWB26104.1 type VI secretion system protein ImpL [Pseudomonas gingeri]NWC36382.1 type VI secretion system protein ImpL [Pseudomonas gingeri]NWD03977.1 type VI secretion system protein ImpL [Pseudomonas gingeri]NWE33775.1 type VI secretion system protein ImpL [Pseudomonas gingeri]NWE58139.1 type VI secretion system protein ImpL [Pseudomonas gingeri]